MSTLRRCLPSPLLSMRELARVARRELDMRERAYPRLVAEGRATQWKAQKELSAMVQITALLEMHCRLNERAMAGAGEYDLWEAARAIGMNGPECDG